ncbi:hypothetical protein BDD43_1778 [Mucilaginibacter gracilis]|uniref:Uncharacterized protein n=1 Tax=Mucilaginibacter gracilis TaxID=423350 RepID=A0A495IZT8_9SPHI|nr:hypothetical protein [Mucilaginibacter gracilis]RKR81628.1 hypothetical protein BDD43_1778 [Mucilaginibacter gracilis]
MKKILVTIAMLSALAMVSCKKGTEGATPAASVTSTSEIKAPTGFTWESSRNISFTINITDTRFPATASLVSIYDADPNNGGNLLAKGAATTTSPFNSKLYISNQILAVYIVKTSPDNTNIIQKVQIGTTNVTASIGI